MTDAVLTRRRLVDIEANYADIVESVPGGTMRFEVEPGRRGTMIYASPRCSGIYGSPRETILNDPEAVNAIFSPQELELFQAQLVHAKTPGRFDHRFAIRTPTGRRKHLHMIATPTVVSEGKVVWTAVLLDVSRQAAIEAELARSREILLHSQKNDAIGALSGGMAHDFNNLLAVVLGNLELLQEDRDISRAEDYVREAIAAVLRGRELTRSLLSFARGAQLSPAITDINDVVREMDVLIRRTLPESIDFEASLMGGLWKVTIDRGSFESALLNLAINARDAMPQGGKLTIETANVRLSYDYIETRDETIEPGRYASAKTAGTSPRHRRCLLAHEQEKTDGRRSHEG